MAELFILFGLCFKIRGIAHERKRKATLFILMAIGLWLVSEAIFVFIITFVVAPRVEFFRRVFPYIPFFGFLGGMVGGWIAYLIVKNCPIGTYEAPVKDMDTVNGTQAITPDSTELTAPCEVKLVRDNSFIGCAVPYTLFLNGEKIKLRNGQCITKITSVGQNAIQFETNAWMGTNNKPLYFTVTAGQPAEIHVKAGKFVHKSHKGITLV